METLYSRALQARLDAAAAAFGPSRNDQGPFPRAVIDDFLSAEVLEPALLQFPGPGNVAWDEIADEPHRRLAFANVEELEPACRDFLHFMNTSIVLQFSEK